MPRHVLPYAVFSATAVAFAFACATATSVPSGGSLDAGIDAPASDATAETAAPPKTCVEPAEIKIVRGSPSPSTPDDKDCDPADPASGDGCRFGKCAGWTDPSDNSTRGKCIATCTEMNKQPGQVCFAGSVCRSFPTTSYCLPLDLPFCGADGGSSRRDGGCLNRGQTCTYDDDCCTGSCNPATIPAKCD